ncbi:molybdopterin molybdotransferase MoeA [Aliarcobacter vitoriensis]|uniref:Molybdopterin molybdenumtransferase n=1 Tax=Aliarcobacter vitoriensis TaxID=2011099 RepID=A0A366MSL7_9BACT|nr:molybdopterin molybdotransferase MoeA [Aliarcobacter vitoriensis]RBQ29288.1 molybdopterin molybdenumtransferase MoeA [Aliarcobacter vitoriensis]
MKERLNYLDFKEACKTSLELVNSTNKTEIIDFIYSLGRVASKDIVCVKNLPSFNNSAMDGFAIKYSDAGKTLRIKDTIFAGDKREFESLEENECYKIMTGAKTPSDIDTIVPIEFCENVLKDSVTIPQNIKKGANLRLKGEELKQGDIIIKKGEKINSSHIALFSSQGLTQIDVFKKIKIAILSTGNELKEPWEKADDEEIYNCNAFAIDAQLKEKNFESTYCGVIPDSLEKSIEFIKNLRDFDIIVTSGGISMGDADFVAQAFLKCGLKIAYHGVNLKPGRAMMMGTLNHSLVISLPGNPLAAMINCYLFVIPILKKFQGEIAFYHDFTFALNKKEFNVKQNRTEAVLGKIVNGEFIVTRDNKYGSGMISAVFESNSLVVSSGNSETIKDNCNIKILEFNGKYISKKVDFIN